MSGGQISSIEITTQPTKLIYMTNQSLDTSGIVVKANISDISTQIDVTGSITYSVPSGDTTNLQAGDTTVTCKLTLGSRVLTTTYSITVKYIYTAYTKSNYFDRYLAVQLNGTWYNPIDSQGTITVSNIPKSSSISFSIITGSGGGAGKAVYVQGTAVASVSYSANLSYTMDDASIVTSDVVNFVLENNNFYNTRNIYMTWTPL